MRITHVGDTTEARNRAVVKALQRAGAAVRVVDVAGRMPIRALRLWRALAREPVDLLFIGIPGHGNVVGARLSAIRTPIVFDAFVSVYENAVEDRLTVREGSLASRRMRFQDRLPCRLAQAVLLDTNEHIRYFRDELDLPSTRFRRVWIGSDDEVMRPSVGRDHNHFRVLFVGSFIPLHGTQHIVRAARLVTEKYSDIEFVMIGSGQTHDAARDLAERLAIRSMRFLSRVPYEALPQIMASSDIALGIFGTTTKAMRVIPSKVFDAFATARPVITADTPAAREILVDGVHCRLCAPGSSDELAQAILDLKASPSKAEALAKNGHALFNAEFSIDALARHLAVVIREVVNAGSVPRGQP